MINTEWMQINKNNMRIWDLMEIKEDLEIIKDLKILQIFGVVDRTNKVLKTSSEILKIFLVLVKKKVKTEH